MATEPPPFAHGQIEQYFDRIRLPDEWRLHNVAQSNPQDALAYLTLLQKQHLLHVPFENLSLHYSPARRISIHPDELFRKIVETPGRGGYCMELNAIFGRLLRSLGFSVYATGARVSEGEGFGGWSHMLNIVTIGKNKYMVDVGFGSNYVAVQPLKLVEGGPAVTNVRPASCRVVKKVLDGALHKDDRLWVYQHKIRHNADFVDMLCFSEVEFRHADFEVMNWYTSTSPKTWFTQRIVCTKMVDTDARDGEITGVLDISDKGVKTRIGAESKQLEEFCTDSDRVVALRKWFDITLTQAEIDAIKGTAGEVKG